MISVWTNILTVSEIRTFLARTVGGTGTNELELPIGTKPGGGGGGQLRAAGCLSGGGGGGPRLPEAARNGRDLCEGFLKSFRL